MILGAILYYIVCPEVYFVRIIDYYTNLNIHIDNFVEQNILTRIFRNHFFDFIWAFSFTCALELILSNDAGTYLKGSFICVIVGIALELLQLVEGKYGTFDVLDILFEILGAVSAVLIIIIIRRKKT